MIMTHDQKVAMNVVSALREVASRMAGIGQYMQAIEGNANMALHGREIEDASGIAAAWSYDIEREYGLKDASKIPQMGLDYTKAMKCTWGGLGDKIMNFIVESGLLDIEIECGGSPEQYTITKWSANSAEQIEAYIADLARQGTVPCPLCGQSQSTQDDVK